MKTSRRAFIHGIGALAAATLLPRTARGLWLRPELHFANKSLRDGAFMIGDLPSGGNVLAVSSELGPIVVDAKHAHLGSDVVNDVHSLFDKKPALLINTHHHADHAGGNWAFSDVANIIAHKNLNPRIAGNLQRYANGADGRVRELEQTGATEAELNAAKELTEKIKTLKVEQCRAKQDLTDGVNIIDHGGVAIQCFHYGNGHTDNDLVVFFPKLNIMHMGDLLFHNLHPFIDRSAKANTTLWQKALHEAMKLGDDETIVIPGHGEVTDKTALPKMIAYFDQLRDVVSKAIAEGKSRDEVVAMKPEVFKDRGFEQIRPVAFGAMYDELKEAK